MPIDKRDFTLLRSLHSVSFRNADLQQTAGKGWGIVCTEDVTAAEHSAATSLMTIPHDLVLNTAAVEEFAKESRNFQELYDAVSPKDNRQNVLLYLLVQLVTGPDEQVVSSCWNGYKEFLPHERFLPTQWTENERDLLRGTSLEAAVHAKLMALTGEFENVRDKSSELPFWNDLLWLKKNVKLQDWIKLDAWYRSRCLELPKSGHSMVPFLDMVNHSETPTAYYDENSKDEIVLSLRPGASLQKGQEITISYGETKSAAEMLFSYGFLDRTSQGGSLVLPLEPFADDPLRIAKLYAYGEQPKVHVSLDQQGGGAEWESPFAYLMCVNEEDGLEFRILQDVEGNQEMRVFWQDEDVTERTKDFETLIHGHPISEVLKLRVVTVVQECLQEQLKKSKNSWTRPARLCDDPTGIIEDGCISLTATLRRIEEAVLEKVVEAMEKERAALAYSDNVVAYLGSMETSPSELVAEEASNGEDDFS